MYTEIKTFEDACNKLKIETTLPNVSMLREQNKKSVIANYKLDVIQEAINEDWKPNWDNSEEYKYYPWFRMSSSGVGFSYFGYVYVLTLSYVGSRRVFKESKIATYVGKQFIELYKDAMIIE